MPNKKVELPMPIFFICLSLFTLFYCTRIPSNEAVFLMIIALIILATSVGLLVATLKGKVKSFDTSEVNLLKVLVMLAVLVVYAVALKYVGYIPSTLFLGIFIIRFLGYKSWIKNILFCVLVTALVFIIFKVLLTVPLPPTPFLPFLS